MSRVFIIGAVGKVGRHLVSQLAGRGHQPMAMHRNPEQAAELRGLVVRPSPAICWSLMPVRWLF